MSTSLTIQITPAHGLGETFTVDNQRLRIGSAAHCEVRLPLADAAPEHVAIEDRGLAGIYAEALAHSPAPTINGVPFSVAPLLATDVLEIAGTKLRISVAAGVAVGQAGARQQKSNPLLLIAAIVLIPLGISQLSFGAEDESFVMPAQAPSLFAAKAPTCPRADPESAQALATEQLQVAIGKRERRPFHAHDGVQGVSLFRQAADCFRLAADSAAAADAERSASSLEQELDDSYRTHRVRLEHALSIKDYVLSRVEVRALRDLTAGLSGGYVTWLSNLERRLKMKELKPQ